ncbi:MAG: DUF2079 domain-containing protein [Vulcanimicrobiaceae bacterium]
MTSTAFARRTEPCSESGLGAEMRLLFAAGCAAQFVLLVSVSIYETAHASLTWDFATYYQAFWLIAHGDMQPFSSLGHIPFSQIHANFLMWPLAALGALDSAPLTLKLLQDVALSGASLVALLWSGEILAQRVENAPHRRLILKGILLTLVLNPWTYASNAFDFHFYSISALALLGLGRALFRGRAPEAFLWALLGISAGDVTATQVCACAFGIAFCVRRARPAALAITAAAGVWFAYVARSGLVKGDILSVNYGYLARGVQDVTPFDVLFGLLTRPQIVADKIAAHWDILYANLAPGGFAGLFSPLTGVPIALTLFENVMSSTPASFYISPGGQNCPVYLLMVPGLAASLGWVYQRLGPRQAFGLTLLAAVNAAGWFYAMSPILTERWNRSVSDDSIAQIARIERLAGSDGEVIASQRIVGALAGRRNVYGLPLDETVPLATRTFVAILSTDGPPQSYAVLEAVAKLANAHVLYESNEFWTFEVDKASPGTLTFPKAASTLEAFVLATDYGRRDFASHAMTTERAPSDGYLVRGAYWRQPAGRYIGSFTVASSAPVTLEVWDISSNHLVARARYARGGHLLLPFTLVSEVGRRSANDWPFHYRSAIAKPDDMLDLRVRIAPGGRARAETVSLFESRSRS